VGDGSPTLVDHPNYIAFHFGRERLPGIDDCLRWVGHLTLRRLQARAVEAELHSLHLRLLRRPCRDGELDTIKSDFADLCERELRAAESWHDDPASRLAFESTVGWTERFHVGLMHELAIGDRMQRTRQPGADLEKVRRLPWYWPTTDAPDRAAWVVVVELALRNAIEHHWGQAPSKPGWPAIRFGSTPHASILFSSGRDSPTPFCLSIQQGAFDPSHAVPNVPGVFKHHTVWRLHASNWPQDSQGDLPGADHLWRAACAGVPAPTTPAPAPSTPGSTRPR